MGFGFIEKRSQPVFLGFSETFAGFLEDGSTRECIVVTIASCSSFDTFVLGSHLLSVSSSFSFCRLITIQDG